MSYVSQRSRFSFSTIVEYWHSWKAACSEAVNDYYNQLIETNPEGEARHYWNRLKHPQSGIKIHEISDAMLSRLMQQLLDQGISKFAVDRFILELRRNVRSVR